MAKNHRNRNLFGSSGKVFPPESTKPIQVLKYWPVQLKTEIQELPYDFLIFALGGASWKKTGSDGKWFDLFNKKEIPLVPFQSGNTGLELKKSTWRSNFEGHFIKNCRLTIGDLTVAGDLVITGYGIEGK